MSDKQHQEEEQKEVSSTQQTSTTDQIQDKGFQPEVKEYTPLPTTDVKSKSSFKLFSYTGDKCAAKILNYIKMYENLAQRAGWTDEEMKWNLVSYLEEEAFDYYIENVLSKANDLDWEKAKQSILSRFDRYESDPYMDLLRYKWSPRVSLREHFIRVRALGINANRSAEDIIKHLNRIVPAHYVAELGHATDLQQWSNVCSVLEAKDIQQKNSHNNGGYNQGKWNRRGNRHSKPRSNQQNQADMRPNTLNKTSNESHDA